jgi:acyl carrier protein
MASASQTLNPEDLRVFVADVLDIDPASLTDDAHFVAELGLDSLKALEVMVALEKRFDIAISEDELKDITNFAEVRDLVTSKITA